ncbi:hypothetical protein V8E36_006729 [Tilletia maclaganii]
MASTSTATTSVATSSSGQPMFTCLSCNVAFPNAHDQRSHYRTDWHRYNAKRRVAQLPPIRQDVFDQKVAAVSSSSSSSAAQESAASSSSAAAAAATGAPASDAQQSVTTSSTDSSSTKCDVCSKSFSNPNILKDHLQSKKHKEQALNASMKQARQLSSSTKPLPTTTTAQDEVTEEAMDEASASTSTADQARITHQSPLTLNVPDNATEEEINALIDAKLAVATRIDPARSCLFCPSHTTSPPSLDATLEHMQRAHGFFIPEREYLIDLPGLMTYLADKVTVGNICLYCNARGKSFTSLDAVRKHMLDKSHCKIAYFEEVDQLELSDFYDFTSSYPDEEDEEWEDMDGVQGAGDGEDAEMDDAEDDAASKQTASRPRHFTGAPHYGDTEYELVLPSGARLGHRALRRYYNQTLWTTPATQAQELHRQRLLTAAATSSGLDHENAMLVHNRGGKQNAVLAKSRGQAREATRHVREFRDVQRREQYKTRVAYTNNNQKHFRDPLLQ